MGADPRKRDSLTDALCAALAIERRSRAVTSTVRCTVRRNGRQTGRRRRPRDLPERGTPAADTDRPEARRVPTDRERLAGVTDWRRTALEIAYYAGFFEWPRGASGAEVANLMGVAPDVPPSPPEGRGEGVRRRVRV